MYVEVEKYLNKTIQEICSGEMKQQEFEQEYEFIKRLYYIELINKEELEQYEKKSSSHLFDSIDSLPLSARATSCLNRENVKTLYQLRKLLLGEYGRRSLFEMPDILK